MILLLRDLKFSTAQIIEERSRLSKVLCQKSYRSGRPRLAISDPKRFERLERLNERFLFTAHRRLVNLMDRRAAAAALSRAAAGEMDESFDERHVRSRHGRQSACSPERCQLSVTGL